MTATSSPCRKGTVTPSNAVTTSGPLMKRRLTPRASMAGVGTAVLLSEFEAGMGSTPDQQPPVVRQDEAWSLNQPPTS